MATATAPRVMIASPTPGETKTVYNKTVMATMADLANHGIYAEYMTEDSSDIAFLRNLICTTFVESNCTHLYTIDADMMHDELVCRTLLSKQKQFIGTVPAVKQFHFDRMEAALKCGVPFKDAILFGYDWLFYPVAGQDKWTIENGITAVDRVGFGNVLLEKSVFTTMIDRGVAKPYSRHWRGKTRKLYNFFGARAQDVDAGEYISEDISFCHRWFIDCGKDMWALVDATIWHVGDFAYGGNYFDYLNCLSRIRSE